MGHRGRVRPLCARHHPPAVPASCSAAPFHQLRRHRQGVPSPAMHQQRPQPRLRRGLALLPLLPLLLLRQLPRGDAACSTSCYSSTCDDLATGSGISCVSLVALFNCDCTGCGCDTAADYDPHACADVPGFQDGRDLTCADYDAAPALCDDAQAYTLPGLLAATEACCVCIPETAEYAVPVSVQNVVVGDAEAAQMYASNTQGTSANLDDSCWLVNTTSAAADIVLFGQAYTGAFVCANGVIAFGAPELSFTPRPFPSSDTPLIAPYWADVDVRCGTSKALQRQTQCRNGAYYWQFFSADDATSGDAAAANASAAYLHALDRRIRQLYDPDFSAATLLVATWDAVGYFELASDRLNSFQAAVATASDGSGDTYACFYYRDLQWEVGTASAASYAQMGFDAGDGTTFYAHPASFTTNISGALTQGLPFCYRMSSAQICAQGFEYIDGACVPMPCTEFSSGLFADRYVATDCAFPLATGDTCALKCVNGKVGLPEATMETTCFAGQLVDPGDSCTEPGISVVPSRLSLVEGGTATFSVVMLTYVTPGLPVVLVPNITLVTAAGDPLPLPPGASTDAADYVVLTSAATGAPLDKIFFDAASYADTVTVNVTAVDNAFVSEPASPLLVAVDFAAVSLDPGYAGYTPPGVLVAVEDDDFAAVVAELVVGGGQVREPATVAAATTTSGGAADPCDAATADASDPGVTALTYVLTSQPSAAVTLIAYVAVAAADGDVGGDNETALGVICGRSAFVFDADSWDVPQQVLVAAVPNDRDDSSLYAPASPAFTVRAGLRTDDPDYQGLAVPDVVVTYVNDDHSGVSVGQAGELLAEEGGAGAVVGLVLDSQPVGDVVLYVAVNDTANCAVTSGARLTFTPGAATGSGGGSSWADEQFVEVAALEDDVVDDSVVCGLTATVTSPADAAYAALSLPGPLAVVRKADNDHADLEVNTVGSQPLLVTPEGGSALFTVALTARPQAPVVLGFEVLYWNATFAGPTPTANNGTNFTLQPARWAAGDNFVVMRCAENLRFETADVNGTASALNASLFGLRVFVVDSPDPAFADLPDSFLSGYCEDNDVFGVTVADQDAVADGSSSSSSSLSAGAQEHDLQGERLFEAAAAAGGGARNFSLYLLSVPSHDVAAECEVILLDPAGGNATAAGGDRVEFVWAGDGGGGGGGNTFRAASASVLETRLDFSLRAVADGVDNGAASEAFCVSCTLASLDRHYDGLQRNFVCGAIVDADLAGLVYSPRSLATAESDAATGTSHAVAVALASKPVGVVRVTAQLSPPATAEARVLPSSAGVVAADRRSTVLTFTPADWAAPQSVVLRGADDYVCEGAGNAEYSVLLTAAADNATAAGDAVYDALPAAEIPGTNIDDDAAGLAVRLEAGASGQATSESPAATALLAPPTLHVQLLSQPLATVVVRAASSDPTEGVLDMDGDGAGGGAGDGAFVFTPATWNVSQAAAVLGVDDDWIDGDQVYEVLLQSESTGGAGAEGDSLYDGLAASSGALTNVDDNVAAVAGPQTLGAACVASEADAATGAVVKVPVYLASSPTGGVYLNEAAAAGISAANGPGVYNLDAAVVDNDHTPSEWTRSPTADLSTCESGSRYVTVDLGGVYWLTSVVLWHYYADTRQYCSQSLLLSATGAFAGEEAVVFDTGTGYGPVETADGHTVAFNATAARYVRHHCGRSTLNTGIHFMEIDVYGFAPVAVTVTSSDPGAGELAVWPANDAAGDGAAAWAFGPSAALAFDRGNWSTPQYVAVRGVDDAVAGGAHDFALAFAASSTGDPFFGDGTPSFPSASAAIETGLACATEDNDAAGLRVAPLPLSLTAPASSLHVTTESAADPRHALHLNVSLTSEPTATVVVTAASSDAAEGVVVGAGSATLPLFFDAGNWRQPQVVVVQGVDDAVVDGPRDYTVAVAVLAAGDEVYAELADSAAAEVLAVRNLDDDAAGVVAAVTDTTQVPAPTSEAGDVARTLNVRLASQPAAPVAVALAVTDQGEGRLSAAAVWLTVDNWEAGVDVVVSGVDDHRQDGSADFAVVLNVTSVDPLYNGTAVAPVRFVNLDDDVAAVAVAHDSDLTFESGQRDVVVRVRLATRPEGAVEVAAATSDAAEGVVLAPTTVAFNATDWNATKTLVVRGVDDARVDGPRSYNVTFSSAGSADAVYAALPARVDGLVNVDDDAAGLAVARAPAGCFAVDDVTGGCTLRVALTSQPYGNVTVAVASGSADAVGLQVAGAAAGAAAQQQQQLTFSPSDWDAPQRLNVVGVTSGSGEDVTVSASVASVDDAVADAGYAALAPARLLFVHGSVGAFVVANVTYVASAGNNATATAPTTTTTATPRTTESGGVFGGTVFLTTAPEGWVLVRADVSDTAEARVEPALFNFSAGSAWAAPGAAFTVTGVDDSLDDGDRAYAVGFTVVATAAGADADAYLPGGLANHSATAVSAVNEDDDESKLVLAGWDGAAVVALDEAGTSRTLAVRLASQPYGNVEVAVASSDAGEVAVSLGGDAGAAEVVLTFSADDWAEPQTVTLTGVADGRVDGDQDVVVTATASRQQQPASAASTTSAAPPSTYDGVRMELALVNVDEDEGGASVALAAGAAAAVVTESGPSSFQVAVRLSSRPLGAATLTAASSDVTAAVVAAPAAVVVDPADWAAPVYFTVTAVDDAYDDGDQPFAVSFAVSCPEDPLFDGFPLPDLAAVTLDDDATGVGVRAGAGARITAEAGAPPAVVAYVRLLSRPYAGAVTVPVASSDPTEGAANVTELVFSRADVADPDADDSWWARERAVWVVGVDDDLPDGTVAYALQLGPAESSSSSSASDDAYDGAAASLSLANLDDDVAGVLVTQPAGVAAEVFETLAGLGAGVAGASYTYTLQLDSEPLAPVDVTVAATTAAGAARVALSSPATLVFDASNWDEPQAVVVEAVDTPQDDGEVTVTLAHAVASADVRFTVAAAASVAVLVVDDDVAGIAAAVAADSPSLATGEDGTAVVELAVSLTAAPAAGRSVRVAVASSDATEGAVDAVSSFLYFTADDFNVTRRVTVRGVDDQEADGDVAYSVLLACDGGEDDNGDDGEVYGHGGVAAAAAVALTNVDDEYVGLLVEAAGDGGTPDASGFVTSEDKEVFVALNVALSFQPADGTTVVVYASSADPTEVALCGDGTASSGAACGASPGAARQYQSLVFTAANWASGRTLWVVGVDDRVADGDQATTVTLEASLGAGAVSAAVAAAAVRTAEVAVVNEDDDVAAVVVDANFDEAVVSEYGPAATFTVRLASEPMGAVAVTCASNKAGLGYVSSPAGGALLFTYANWNTPQEVAVLATQTNSARLDTPFVVSCAVTSATDATYDALDGRDPEPLTFLREDLTVAGFASYKRGYQTSETGREVDWFVRTLSPPRSTVLVKALCTPVSEAVATPSQVAITASNWDTYQPITIVGLDDDVDDGDRLFQVFFEVASNDAVYRNEPLPTLSFINVDDDERGVTAELAAPVSDVLHEAAASVGQAFTVALHSEPTSDVVVRVVASDPGAGTVVPTEHTFSPGSWSSAATFVAYPVDNAVQDGGRAFRAVASFASADANYAPPVQANVSFPFTVVDDDQAGVAGAVGAGLVRLDEGGFARVPFTLLSEPAAPVTLSMQSLDVGELALLPLRWGGGSDPAAAAAGRRDFVLDATNWSVGFNLTLWGVLDDADDGDLLTGFAVAVASAGDPYYDGLLGGGNSSAPATVVAVEVVDVDVAGLWSSPPAATLGDVTENGTAVVSFALRLGTRPTADVAVALALSDATECAFAATGAGAGAVEVEVTAATEATARFTRSTWGDEQIVAVRGVDDFIDDGDQPCSIRVVAVVSADPVYAALLAEGGGAGSGTDGGESSAGGGDTLYVIRNLDDDEAGAELTPLALTVLEADARADPPLEHAALLVLRSEPMAPPVLVRYNTTNPAEAAAAGVLVFGASNWSDPQRVVVVAVDDDRADGNAHFAVEFAPAESAGPDYDGLDLRIALDVTTLDDDVVGVVLEWAGEYEPPAATAPTVVFADADPDDDKLGGGGVASGDANSSSSSSSSSTTTTASATSAPSAADLLRELAEAGPTLYCSENDTSAVWVTARLTSEPYGPVTVAVDLAATMGGSAMAYDPATGASLDPDVVPAAGRLEFAPLQWNQPQTLAVRCVRDWRADGNRLSVLRAAVSAAGDAAYDGFDIDASTAVARVVSKDADVSEVVVLVGDAALAAVAMFEAGSSNTTPSALATSTATSTTTSTPATTATTALRGNSSSGGASDSSSSSSSSTPRLETNSSGAADYVAYVLTSRPYHPVTVQLTSGMPAEGSLAPSSVTFSAADFSVTAGDGGGSGSGSSSTTTVAAVAALAAGDAGSGGGEWQRPQLVAVAGRNSSSNPGKTVVYDIAQAVATNDTSYARRKLGLLTVVNEYPVAEAGDTVVVQTGFTDFGEFLNTSDGSIVWYIVGGVVVVVLALTIGLVVMKLSYRKKIQQEREQAISERAALAAGAADVDITWNSSDATDSAGHKPKAAQVVAVSTAGVVVGGAGGGGGVADATEAIQRRMGMMVGQMQAHLKELHAENVGLAQQHGVPPCALPELEGGPQALFESEDASLLLETIKQLKLHNYEIQEGQVSRRKRRPKKKSGRKKQSGGMVM